MENKIFIGIGSNLGDSLETIKKTIEVLKAEKSIDFISTSSIYLTKAIGYENQPDFMNAVFFCQK